MNVVFQCSVSVAMVKAVSETSRGGEVGSSALFGGGVGFRC